MIISVGHLPGWITSVPLLSEAVEAVGRLHGADCSSIRLWSHHIHDDSCPSLHSGAHPAYQGVEPQACMAARAVLSVGFSAYCSVPCIPLRDPRQCIGTTPLRVLSHASRFRQRPECVEIDAWATVGGAGEAFIARNPHFVCTEWETHSAPWTVLEWTHQFQLQR